MIAVVLVMAAWASLVTRWPYNLALTLNDYAFGEFDSDGWSAYWHSVQLAVWTAVIGTVIVFVGAYLLEKPVPLQPGGPWPNSWPCCPWRCRV
jgi:iron(III) transport system permease protein